MSQFQPFMLAEVKKPEVGDAAALVRDLKKRFPRDFGQRSTGKRSKMMEINVIELEPQELETYVFHEKKRERKSKRKIGAAQRDYDACFDAIQEITNNKVRKLAEDMLVRSNEDSQAGAVSPVQSGIAGSLDSPVLLVESEDE